MSKAIVSFKGVDLYSKKNTLKDRVTSYCGAVMFRKLRQEQLKAELDTLKTALDSYKKLSGSMLYPGEEKVKATVLAVADTTEKLKAVTSLPEAKFRFDTEADKKLRQEWKTADTDTLRGVAIAHWIQAHGCTCADTVTCCFELGQWLKNLKDNQTDAVLLDGEAWEVAGTYFPFRKLMGVMIDWMFDASLMKEDAFPEELREIYRQKREAAKARREARKAAKKESKKEPEKAPEAPKAQPTKGLLEEQAESIRKQAEQRLKDTTLSDEDRGLLESMLANPKAYAMALYH